MTVDETLNATFHAIERMQIETLRALQQGAVKGPPAIELLRSLDIVERAFRRVLESANHSPELYAMYAAPGGSANVPSLN
jgi:hypothetical protein